ncbi:MAG: VOC family protein [Gammaproteobacteria bacterium]
MQNQFVWVDIPVANLDRALRFYSAVLGSEVTMQSFSGVNFGLLPHEEQSVSGCLVESNDNKPSQTGPLVYLNVDGRMDIALSAVRENDGKVVQNSHQIGEHGYRAVVIDSEGNKVALHSAKP